MARFPWNRATMRLTRAGADGAQDTLRRGSVPTSRQTAPQSFISSSCETVEIARIVSGYIATCLCAHVISPTLR